MAVASTTRAVAFLINVALKEEEEEEKEAAAQLEVEELDVLMRTPHPQLTPIQQRCSVSCWVCRLGKEEQEEKEEEEEEQ